MIWQTSAAGFVNAMNAAFEAAHSAANHPSIAHDPAVLAARAAAAAAHANALNAVGAVLETRGFFRRMKANFALWRQAHAASAANNKFRKAIDEALIRKMEERSAVAEAAVDELRRHGDQWKPDEELPKAGEVHSTPKGY